MSTISIIILIPTLLLALNGLRIGVVKVLGGLIAFVLSLFVVFRYSAPLAGVVLGMVGINPWVALVLSSVVLFSATMVAFTLLGKLVTRVLGIAGLGMLNRILGALVGALQGWLLVGALVVFLEASSVGRGLLIKWGANESALYKGLSASTGWCFQWIETNQERLLPSSDPLPSEPDPRDSLSEQPPIEELEV